MSPSGALSSGAGVPEMATPYAARGTRPSARPSAPAGPAARRARDGVVAGAAAGVAPPPGQQLGSQPTEAARRTAFTTTKPTEITEPLELAVSGRVPAWLRGSIVRNGAGFFTPEMTHLFDGYGLLVKFSFDGGRVTTMQRFVRSRAFSEWERTGAMQFSEFGTMVPPLQALKNTLVGALKLGQGFTDNASVNTSVSPDTRSMVAMTEVVQGTYAVDLASLATQGQVRYSGDEIPGDLTSAHPAVDPDGTLYNLFTDLGRSRCVAKIDPRTHRRTRLAEVPMAAPFSPSWVHDLPATEHYIIVPDTPVLYDAKALVLGGGDYVVFKWDPQTQPTQFHLVPKAGGAVTTVPADFDFMTFHYANAFESEDGKELYLDTPAFRDPSMVNALKLDNMRGLLRDIQGAPFSRITIPLDGRRASIRTLIPPEQYHFTELLRVNPAYKMRRYRYAYAVTARPPCSFGNALSKLDAEAGSSVQWHEPGCIPTEPLMTPRPGATAEDDGVVTSLVSGADGRSFLLVLDAATFTEVARAQLPHGVAYGFHNQWFPDQF